MDPYVYPGTNVLKNFRNIRQLDDLLEYEMDMTSRRQIELLCKPIRGKFDIAHLQAIHYQLFRDVYPWAGLFRTINIARSGQFFFAFSDHIVPALGDMFAKLSKEQFLAKTDVPTFSDRAAYFMGELNAIHPFRDGNGRTQREFIRELALKAGHTIHWVHITRDQMSDASRRSFQEGGNSGLSQLLQAAIT